MSSPYPERIIQFGDTPLLRGTVDYLIDQLNEQSNIKLGITIVSLHHGITDSIPYNQPQPYSIVTEQEQGIQTYPVKSVGRWLSALDDFPSVLQVAHNPLLRYVIVSEFSSTSGTSVGENSFIDTPPLTTVGKICRFLFERFQSLSKGYLVIMPCDDAPQNADNLLAQVKNCAMSWHLDGNFVHWLEQHSWCNTVLEGAVWPLSAQEREILNLPPNDFSLKSDNNCFLAMQGAANLAEELQLPQLVINWLVCDNLELYRQQKKVLMSSTLALIMPLGSALGYKNVYDAISDVAVYDCIFKILSQEIAHNLPIKDENLDTAITSCIQRLKQPIMKNWSITLYLAIENYRDYVLSYILKERFTRTNKQQPARSLLVLAVLLSLFCTQNVKEKSVLLTHNPHIYNLFLSLWARSPYNYSHWYTISFSTERLIKKIFAASNVWGEDLSTCLTHIRLTTTHLSHLETHGLPDLLLYLSELKS